MSYLIELGEQIQKHTAESCKKIRAIREKYPELNVYCHIKEHGDLRVDFEWDWQQKSKMPNREKLAFEMMDHVKSCFEPEDIRQVYAVDSVSHINPWSITSVIVQLKVPFFNYPWTDLNH